MSDSPLPKKTPTQWLCAVTTASCFVCLTQMLGRDQLTPWLHWSVGLFAFAIPVLSVFSFRSAERRHQPARWSDVARSLLSESGLLAGFLGLAAVVGHFGGLYAAGFVASGLLAVGLTAGKESPKDA